MKLSGWYYRDDCESAFNGPHKTRDGAICAALADGLRGRLEVVQLRVGDFASMGDFFPDAEWLTEKIIEECQDSAGYEPWFLEDDLDDLDNRLRAAFIGWLKKHGKPTSVLNWNEFDENRIKPVELGGDE